MKTTSEARLWEILQEVKDPEIPVVSLVELGIVRAVDVDDRRVQVTLTPTFSGCPALQVMVADVIARLEAAGYERVEVTLSYDPPWTSDWITPQARQKLKEFGLAPPARHGGNLQLLIPEVVACPYCDSTDTELKNSFGATLCRAIYVCHACRQPFEQFKAI
jgi:ring-1,2-phenylacetyl-CoA epoxidase subunit PaaD